MYQEINRKSKISIIILLVVAFTFVITVSYAYFQTTLGEAAVTNTGIKTYKGDSLSFVKGDDLTLEVFAGNFAQGMGDVTSTTTSSAILKANTRTLDATEHYNVYFHIIKNNFEYTTTELDAELILRVTDPDGNNVTSIDGLTYNGSQQGFDITVSDGVISIANGYTITSHSAAGEQQTWQFELAFINLDSDQSLNEGKTIDAKVVLTKGDYIVPTLSQGSNWSSRISLYKSSITNINFVDSYTPTGTESITWDCSESENSSVMCYLDSTRSVVTIAGNGTGHIFANYDSSYLFSDTASSKQFTSLRSITGLNILKTSYVHDMSNMFLNAGYNSTQFEVDISSWDTSNVSDMAAMFAGTGNNASSWVVIIPPSNENGTLNDYTTIYGGDDTVYYILSGGKEFSVASNV